MKYGAEVITTVSAGSVVLGATPSWGSLSQSGMTLILPTSPRFPGDSLDADLTASLLGVSYGLRAWSVAVAWDSAALSLSTYTVDAIWGDAEVTESARSLQVLVNAPANDNPGNTLVQGADIPILAARLAVGGGAAAGAYAVSAVVNSMINFGTNTFVEAADALALDDRSGGSSAGRVSVEAKTRVGLRAGPRG